MVVDAGPGTFAVLQTVIDPAEIDAVVITHHHPDHWTDLLAIETQARVGRRRRPIPGRIAYVSCEPAPFARDLKVMVEAGWNLRSLRAFDLFPMTEHVELVAILESPRP